VALATAGWELVFVWEHENPIAAADRIEALVRTRRAPA
jgi:DNA mismatch endonuclease (patch repair protein)